MQTKTQLDDLQNYLIDASNMPGGHAESVIIPANTDEVAAAIREANAAKIPVTISGARTGTVGGAIPFGGVVLSLEKLNNFTIAREKRIATVGAGVILADLQKAVEAEGLFYPPDPTEWSCQIGGTVATNASGARSFKYGATRRYVRKLTVVLPNGDNITLERGESVPPAVAGGAFSSQQLQLLGYGLTYERPNVRKNVSGYFNEQPLDAIDLFIGSEGTLGVITEVELDLLPKPEGFFSGIVFFPVESDLLAFVEDVRNRSFEVRNSGKADIDATLIEYFDDRALAFISEKFPETPSGIAGAIFFEQETTAENEDALFEAWNELLERHNADVDGSWFTTTDTDREKLRAFRHALPVSVNERVVRNKQKKIGTDMAVPDDKFAGFLKYQKRMLDASGLEYVIFGHIGDCHLHANMLPRDAAESENARHLYGRFVAQSIMLGGCVSAEHGIGKLKRKYLAAMMGERYLNEMAEVKKVFDPNGILGRGNVFDEQFLN